MTQVLVTKPGVLTAADKRLLRQAGVVPIEAAKPNEVRLLQLEGDPIGGGDMLFAALTGVQYTSGAQAAFAAMLYKLMAQRRSS